MRHKTPTHVEPVLAGWIIDVDFSALSHGTLHNHLPHLPTAGRTSVKSFLSFGESVFDFFFFNMCFETLLLKHLGRLQDRWARGRADSNGVCSFHSQPYLCSLISTCLRVPDAARKKFTAKVWKEVTSLVRTQGCDLGS